MSSLPLLREIEAPPGWTAAILEARYPVLSSELDAYRSAVEELLERLPALSNTPAHEVLLQFDRCRPEVEIPLIQGNGRYWLPEIGLGVWLDRALPTLWTEDEFLAAKPGELRALVYRVFRIQPKPAAQQNAWRQLLGSGVLLRSALAGTDDWLKLSTDELQPMIVEPAFTSYPFYVPLLTEKALSTPPALFANTFPRLMLPLAGYLRESSEDGGLLIVVRQNPESFWKALTTTTPLFQPLPASSETLQPTRPLARL